MTAWAGSDVEAVREGVHERLVTVVPEAEIGIGVSRLEGVASVLAGPWTG